MHNLPGMVSVWGSWKGLICDIMQNVKNKHIHRPRSDSPPLALYITADVLVEVQDGLA